MGGIYARRERHPGLGLEGHLRPVPSGVGLRRSAARGRGRDPLARRPLRLARRALPRSASRPPARRTRTACAAPRSASSRSRSRATGARDWRPGRAPGARRSIPPELEGPARGADARGARDASSPSGCAPCSSGAATRYDEISAVLNVGVWDFADAADRARALSEARRHMDFRSLILAFKRIRNILGDETPGRADARALPRGRREGARRRLPAGALGDRGLHGASGTTARPWRRSPRSRRRSTASSWRSW